jgi:hypothetical protein
MTSFIPLTYEERGMLPAKNPTENGFLEETRFLFPGFIIIDCRANS